MNNIYGFNEPASTTDDLHELQTIKTEKNIFSPDILCRCQSELERKFYQEFCNVSVYVYGMDVFNPCTNENYEHEAHRLRKTNKDYILLVPQFILYNGSGRDFLVEHSINEKKGRFIVECDGERFHGLTAKNVKNNVLRDNLIASCGMKLIKVLYEQLYHHPQHVLAPIFNLMDKSRTVGGWTDYLTYQNPLLIDEDI